LICEKIEEERWNIALCNPMDTIIYNLGTITEKTHLELWKEIILLDIKRHIEIAEKTKKQLR